MNYSGTHSDFRFNGYSNTFYGTTFGWDSGSSYISGSVTIPSWANEGYYDVQVYDYNTWSWLTLNNGFYVSSYQPSNPSFTISPDNGEQGETLNVYISGDNGAQFTDYSGTYSDFRFTAYSNTFYGTTYDWDSGSDYIQGEVSIPSWADEGYYDVQVYDYNTWSWLTLNDGFYISSPACDNLSISGYAYENGAMILGAEISIYDSNQSLVFSNSYADDGLGDEWFNDDICLTAGCYDVSVDSEYIQFAITDYSGDTIVYINHYDWANTSDYSFCYSENVPTSSGNDILFSEDFDSGSGTFTINTDPGSPVTWEHTYIGHVGAYPSPSLESTTSFNGWMIADSDAYGTNGGDQEYTELISPVIDCSNYPNVVLEFEQYFRRWHSDTCIVMTSNDGGVTWSGKYYVNSQMEFGYWSPTVDQSGTDNPDLVRINLSNSIGGSSQAMFKFIWQGVWDYGWQIDDVKLVEQAENDIALEDVLLNFGSRDFNGNIPSNQVDYATYGFYYKNNGALTQYNCTTGIAVDTWDSYSYSSPQLNPDEEDYFYNNNAYMPNDVGEYDFIFSVFSDSQDENPDDNFKEISLSITDTVFNAFGAGEKLGSMGTHISQERNWFIMANMYEL